jgi:cytochrome d ubiquinol oxidase subunit II
METIWFSIVAVMLTAYVLLDGFDIGVGVIHLFAARTDAERREVIGSIGPVWNGNEVWLLAAGGTLYFAFPGLYAAGFSGFYLALMVVLWLLMLRGIAVEFRSHLHNELWRPFWDVVLCAASVLLAIFYGAALGNVVRGVPLGKDGFFFVALWTDFRTGSNPGIIDWYTVSIGLTALLVLAMHGALWVNLKTSGKLQIRARIAVSRLFWPVCVAILAISIASFQVQPQLWTSFQERPWMWVFPLIATTGLMSLWYCQSAVLDLCAFLSSGVFIAGLLCSAAFGLYPKVLPAVPDAGLSLTIYNVSVPHQGLAIGFLWWVPAFLLAITYSGFAYRRFRGKVEIGPADMTLREHAPSEADLRAA